MSSKPADPMERKSIARPNIICGSRLLMICAAAAGLAFLVDTGSFLPLVSTFLLAAAVIRGGSAALSQDELCPNHFNRWDETAALIGLGLLAHFAG